MKKNLILPFVFRFFIVLAFAAIPLVVCNADESSKPSGFIQFGKMHDAIGKKQHQGRVSLTKILSMPHFYGVGALAGLQGEITVLDSVAIITGVTRDGRPYPMEKPEAKATMLLGQSVKKWIETTVAEEVPYEQFDKAVGVMASKKGIDISKPFVFLIKGEFRDVRLHVINGACPIRARIKNISVEKGKQPFELEVKKVRGTLVGIYAADSVGKLTHPATSTHAHLIYLDEKGNHVTGHIEKIGLAKNSVLKFPELGERK